MNSCFFILIYILSVLLSSLSQILLKYSATLKYKKKINEYLNKYVIFGYGLFVVCSVLTIVAFKGVPLKMGPIIESLGYLFVMILACIFLQEKLTLNKVVGNVIIILGIIIFSFK